MQTRTIVGTGPIAEVAVEILRPYGEIVIAPDGNESSLIPLLENAVAVVVRGEGSVSRTVIESAPNLKVIGRSGVGYNNIDIKAATDHRIPVVYTPGAGARAVAEAAMAMMLALCKNLAYWDEQMKTGRWNSRNDFNRNGDLDESTLGIIGFGRIGQLLAEMARPFNMTIIAHDPFVPPKLAVERSVELVELEDLLNCSDFICIHALLTDETRGLINRQRLEQVKRGACLINLARGGLVESLDILHDALEEGRLSAVGLDVFEPEPPDVSHPIFRMSNCLSAPHALGMTRRAMARIFTSMAEDMAAVLTGRQPQFVVNLEVFS